MVIRVGTFIRNFRVVEIRRKIRNKDQLRFYTVSYKTRLRVSNKLLLPQPLSFEILSQIIDMKVEKLYLKSSVQSNFLQVFTTKYQTINQTLYLCCKGQIFYKNHGCENRHFRKPWVWGTHCIHAKQVPARYLLKKNAFKKNTG